jgi:glycosyltransferase involved in cell wall biosynthesis
VTPPTPLDVVAVYGASNAGVRARALAWLEGTGRGVRLSGYFGTNAAGASQFVRYPHRAVRAEFQLRMMGRRRPASLLLIREASPLSRGGAEEAVLRAAEHSVYDLDDALFHDVRGPVFERLFSKSSTAERAVAAASTVIVGNDYLAEWAESRARDVRIIPTCVDPDRYTTKANYEIGGHPRVVWMGTPSGERYLAELHDPLARLNARFGARLTVIGSPRRTLGPMEELIDRVPWELTEAYERLHTYDLGIMPLRDGPYERGKCAYKLLEYGAAGLPVAGSPVGVNARILADAGNDAPRSPVEWLEVLTRLIEAAETDRRAAGVRLHDLVWREFSFDAWRRRWLSTVFPDEQA